VAGNIGLAVPAGAAGASGSLTVNVTARPANLTVPGGPFQYSPNGTVAGINITDPSGAPVASFASPISIVMRYNAADLAMARYNSGILTAGFQVSAATPAMANPNALPPGTWILFPADGVNQDLTAGTITVRTTFVPGTVAVFTEPAGYVRTIRPLVSEFSGWNGGGVLTSRVSGIDLLVLAPQAGGRLLVQDPVSSDSVWVDAETVGPAAVHYDQLSQGHTITGTVSVSG